MRVLFPDPVGPTIATVSPGSTRNDTLRNTSRDVPGYRNDTFLNSIAPGEPSPIGRPFSGTTSGSVSMIERIRPMEASPRWKRFTTHPRAIIGQIRRFR
jgi:hypothetical protein